MLAGSIFMLIRHSLAGNAGSSSILIICIIISNGNHAPPKEILHMVAP